VDSKFSLKDKVAIVTGSGAGIGRATALALADAGAAVVVAELVPETAEAAVQELRSRGHRALKVVVDARDSRQVEDMVRQTVDEFGRIDILVNNAGGLKEWVPIVDMSEEVWDEIFAVNLKTAFLCSREVGKVMIARGTAGSVINFSSIGGFSNRLGLVHYGAAKGAVRLFTDGLAKEWAPHGIRVNAIAPGYVETPMSNEIYRNKPGLKERRMGMIPLGRQAKVDEFATVVVFLASDASSYITGQTILVSGGLDSLVEPKQES
jgi:NAD(P)-dependent dehydrogenase (short-subunit alcohol dehydrogenase family)